jgi:hypothetical protein
MDAQSISLETLVQMFVDWGLASDVEFNEKWADLHRALCVHIDGPPTYNFDDLMREAMQGALANNGSITIGGE